MKEKRKSKGKRKKQERSSVGEALVERIGCQLFIGRLLLIITHRGGYEQRT